MQNKFINNLNEITVKESTAVKPNDYKADKRMKVFNSKSDHTEIATHMHVKKCRK